MKLNWKRINSYRIMTKDGESETYHLETDETGNFRLLNDFGNIKIELDAMSGYEMFKRIAKDYETQLSKEMNSSTSNDDLNCADGYTYTFRRKNNV